MDELRNMLYAAFCAGILLLQSTFAFKISRIEDLLEAEDLVDLEDMLSKDVEKRDRVPYILGGSDASRGKWKWQAAIKFYDQFTGTYDPVCGAALLGPRWLVTATHCIDNTYGERRTDPTLYQIVLGGHNLRNPSGSEVIATPDKFYTHSDFELDMQRGFPNDIALIRLSAAVDLAAHDLQAIKLARPSDDSHIEECYITGWGITQAGNPYSYPGVLQEARAKVISNSNCQQKIEDAAPILDTQVCVGGDSYATACTGDSGSPLSCRVNGEWKLMGIYSWYVKCAGLPSVYTRISSYLDWLAEIMAS